MSKHTHTHKQTRKQEDIFNLILHCLEKYSSTAQELADRQGELLTGAGRGAGRWQREGLLAVGDGGQAAVLLTPDVHIFERLQLEGLCIGNSMHNTARK